MKRIPAIDHLQRPGGQRSAPFKPDTRDDLHLNSPTLPFVIGLLMLHFVLALIMKQFPLFATIHALATIAIGLVALSKFAQQPQLLIYVLAYIAGSELLWRGSGAGIFYETGKYSLIGFSILALLFQRRGSSTAKWPVLYLFLLLPSFSVLPYFDRQLIAFNLAGPVALGVMSIFFSTVHLSLAQFKRVLLAMLIPAVSLGFLALFFTVTAEDLTFTGVSLKATSAGIGPNQVSSVLGLAVVICLCYALVEKQNKSLRIFMIGIALWMVAQTMLTFARGGLWTALGAIAVGLFFLARTPRIRAGIIVGSLILIPLFFYIIFPPLDNFTGNTLSERFQDPTASNRETLARVDWKLFLENPVFGVGPGMSEPLHAVYYRGGNSHTEYSRLLAEHGSFGAAILLVMTYVTLKRLFGNRPIFERAFWAMCTFWALLFLGHSSTRLVIVSLMFALPEMSLDLKENEDSAKTPKPGRVSPFASGARSLR